MDTYDCGKADYHYLKPRLDKANERIAELERENAELKQAFDLHDATLRRVAKERDRLAEALSIANDHISGLHPTPIANLRSILSNALALLEKKDA